MKQNLRLLHLIPSMAGGGAERQLVLLAKEQLRRGHDVTVALRRTGPYLGSFLESGVTPVWLEGAGNHDPNLLSEIASILRVIRPHIVQTWLLQMDVLGGLIALAHGVPWVLSERNAGLAYQPSPKTLFRRQLGRKATAIVANSKQGRAYWMDAGVDQSKIYMVPNAVPFQDIARAADRGAGVGLSSEYPLILHAGRFVPAKNLKVLVRALSTVFGETNAAAMLCGEGPLVDEITQEIEALGIHDRVTVEPFRHDIWSLMQTAAVVVSVGLYEGQPNSVLEAMACGCPLVVSDIPSHRDLLTSATAVFANSKDPESIAHAIIEILQNPQEAQRRAIQGRRTVERFSITACTDHYEGVYRQVLDA